MSSQGEPFHFDPAMLELFRKELSIEAERIEDALTMLKAGGVSQDTYEKILHAAKQIKSAAHIMQFPSLVSLAEALEEASHKIPKIGSKDQSKFLSALQQSTDCIRKASTLPELELAKRIHKRDEAIDLVVRALSSSANVKGSVEEEQTSDSEAPVDPALLSLFKAELENQCATLSSALLSFEQKGANQENYDTMLRAIHSLKGAARVVNLRQVEQLAHLVEDVLVASKKHEITLNEDAVNALFAAIDFFLSLSRQPQTTIQIWLSQQASITDANKASLSAILSGAPAAAAVPPTLPQAKEATPLPERSQSPPGDQAIERNQERMLRVSADSLNRLMGLAGEALVESRWMQPFSELLSHIKKTLNEITMQMDAIKGMAQKGEPEEQISYALKQLTKKSDECQKSFTGKLSDLELYINRNSSLSDRLYREVIDSRMRAFGDGVKAFPRMVRDMAHQLGKKVDFEIRGKSTPVDRDILEMLDTPLAHLLRNAIDHGIETPEERVAKGKTPEGKLILEAEHRAGMLSITVSDDGAGLDTEEIRKAVIDRGLVTEAIATKLSDHELVDFLFLPGFTTSKEVSEISGRGIGLNAVQNMVQSVSGSVHTTFIPGKGMRFNLQLPLTLSVIRALLAEVAKEPYAIPLSRLDRAVFVPQDKVEVIENRQYIHFEGKNVGLISGAQILGFEEKRLVSPQLSVIIINDRANSYGIVVDRFLGEKELVLHPLDPRLGKVPDISSGAFLEDGAPVLIIDIEDVIRSIDNILFTGTVSKLTYSGAKEAVKKAKTILVIDDSITVREVECRLLRNKGYDVDTAINGMEGWNALRMGAYDLVITDVDMPRMNGIELVRAIKADSRLKSMPVMIVSYKERESDRIQGLEAGANYYLTKSGFHDEALLNAVVDLIGEP